jgi:hypothetical protein
MKITCQFAWLFVLALCACSPVATGSLPTAPSPDAITPTPTCQLVCKVENTTSTTPVAIQPISEYSPQAGDSLLTRQQAFVDKQELIATTSSPPQYSLHQTGSLPTPCSSLRVDVKSPDASNLIAVDVYSVTSTNQVCAQVTKPFDVSIPIVVASGSYMLSVNSQSVGKLDMP